MGSSFELLLVRHGQTALHAAGLMVGWRNDPGLDDEGRRQAAHQAEELARRPAECLVRAIYSSPLPRARQTAEIIAARLDLPVRIEDDLRDIDIGDWAGRPVAELRATDLWTRYHRDPEGVRLPGGEEITEVRDRVIPVIERIRRAHQHGAVVVVSHADVIKMILLHYARVGLRHLHKVEQPGYASCISLEEWVRLNAGRFRSP